MMSQSKSRSNVLLMLFYCIKSAMKDKSDHKGALRLILLQLMETYWCDDLKFVKVRRHEKHKESFQLRHWKLFTRYSTQHIIYVCMYI